MCGLNNKRSVMEKIRRNKKAILFFLLPGFLLYTVLLMLPIGGSFILAFFKWNGIKGVPTTVIGLLWYFILMPTGVLNTVLRSMGLDRLVHMWLVEKNTAMTSIILVNTWCGIGFHMTVSYAAISGIPDDVIEASKLDGAVGLKKVRYIIIPMIWESIISSIVVIVTAVLKTFDLVYVMTSGGPNGLTDVPSTLLYKEAFQYNNFGKASVIGVYIFILSIFFYHY